VHQNDGLAEISSKLFSENDKNQSERRYSDLKTKFQAGRRNIFRKAVGERGSKIFSKDHGFEDFRQSHDLDFCKQFQSCI